ncbi:MAG: DUF2797 domain-containing protein [Chitinophagales bacterium]|jgi:hypothetical protein|nr:DUF2797 domain-containing protein [Chitinophagales bacterium]
MLLENHHITKMHFTVSEDMKVEYFLGNLSILDLIGKQVTFSFQHLKCLSCEKIVKKFYGQGLCYICLQTSSLASECIVNPELCRAHEGIGRDLAFEEQYHNKPHVVYIANSGGYKVGVTQVSQIPQRWVDQGANYAMIFAKTPYRQLAGLIEIVLKPYISDKTHWLKMLRGQLENYDDFLPWANLLREKLSLNLQEYILENQAIYPINYPLPALDPNIPIKSIKLDKTPIFTKKLMGVKGQYLIFEDYHVLQMRNHSGYVVHINIE